MPTSDQQLEDEAAAMARFFGDGGRGDALLGSDDGTAGPAVDTEPRARQVADPASRVQGLVAAWLDSDEVESVRAAVDVVVEEAQALKKVDLDTDYQRALALTKSVKGVTAELKALFDTVQPFAHKAWKALSSANTEIRDRLEAEEKRLKGLAAAFEDEQGQKRREAEAALQKQLQAQEREQRDVDAMLAEEEGRASEAEAIREAPSTVPPVTVAKDRFVPKVAGTSRRETWKAEVADLAALAKAVVAGTVPIQAIQPDQKFLNQQARALKSALTYPGVRAYAESTMAVR